MIEFNLTLIIFIVSILILIYLSGWYSSTETALTNLNLIDIINLDKHEKSTKFIKNLKVNLDLSLIAILIMNNIVNVLLSILPVIYLGVLLSEFLLGILVSVITITIILFGDIIPKSRAIAHKNKIIKKNARIMYYNFILIKPLVYLLIKISKFINKLLNEKNHNRLIIDDKAIKKITNLSEKAGSIKKIEKELIHNILSFGDLKIKEIMIENEKVYTLSKDYKVSDARKIISKTPYTRIPYIENNKIKGVLYVKDLLKNDNLSISKIVRKPFIIDREEDISTIFKKMKLKKVHLGIITNELDEIEGVITLEDIVETIVGDIKDEYYKEKGHLL